MAVDSRGVGKAVCWPPRGQYGNGIKIAGQFLGFLCMPFAEKEKEFKEEGRAAHWAGLRRLKRIEVIIFSFPYIIYTTQRNQTATYA